MAIYSMTAFGRKEIKADWGTAVWEIRSVNQRFLETYFRLPEQFRSLDPVLRERLKKRLQRGKVETQLRYELNQDTNSELSLNETLAQQLIEKARWISSHAGGPLHINPIELMRWPGVMQAEEADLDQINADMLQGFDAALEEFIAARASEGEAMAKLIEDRLQSVTEQVALVRERMPEIMEWQKERLQQRLEDANVEADSGRLEQELVLQAQRVDVAEELDRLDTHVAETRKILKKGGACGRRLDFMMQEFNRESNTLGSKSISTEITNAAVELKVLIEQMREQIQNIE